MDLVKKIRLYSIISHKKIGLAGLGMREKDTATIDLTLPLDEIFSRFNDTTRNEIRRTQDST